MESNDFPTSKPIVVELQAADRWQAIDELVDYLVKNNEIRAEDRDAIVECVKKRESSMGTGIGGGIGLPHAATQLVSGLVLIIGRSQNGIQFDAADGKPVKKVALFLVPQNQLQQHVHTLASILKLLKTIDLGQG